MPQFRPKQKEVLTKCWEAFMDGKKLILLQAPVGFGKSAVNTALCRYYAPSIYTTPQLSLIDQIMADNHLGKHFTEIKGRDNYRCAKDRYLTLVRHGLCKREKDVIPQRCSWLTECPYYSQKLKAIQSPIAIMSLAYFIVDAYVEPPNFDNRALVVIDEGHFLAEYVANQVSLEVSKRTLPQQVLKKYGGDYKDVKTLAEYVKKFLDDLDEKLEKGHTLTEQQVEDMSKAEDWLSRAKVFLDTEMIADWVWISKNGGYIAKPVYSRWFMSNIFWDRAEKFLISSATILKPDLWIRECGADIVFSGEDILFIDVGSTFPPERRRVVDMAVGSMRYDEIEDNINAVTKMLEYIIRSSNGKNIAVHLPSYRLAERIYSLMGNKDRVYLPQPENRDAILAEWKRKGGVFFAVAYHEGQDWKYDTCQVQVLVKTLYPDATDPIIKRRLEKKEYQWLMWTALVKCLQAYGRAIRAEDDYMEFYVLDEKFWELVRRNWSNIPKWFKDAIPQNRWPKKYQPKSLSHSQNTTP